MDPPPMRFQTVCTGNGVSVGLWGGRVSVYGGIVETQINNVYVMTNDPVVDGVKDISGNSKKTQKTTWTIFLRYCEKLKNKNSKLTI
jgi:hypothetical protein